MEETRSVKRMALLTVVVYLLVPLSSEEDKLSPSRFG